MIASTLVVDHDKPLNKLFAPTVTRSLLLGSTLINQIFLINQGDFLCYHLWDDCDCKILFIFFCIEYSYFISTLTSVCLDCTSFLTKAQYGQFHLSSTMKLYFPSSIFSKLFLCKYFAFGCSNLSILFLGKQWNWQSSHPRKMLSKFHLICADSLQPSAKYNYFLPATSFYFSRNFWGIRSEFRALFLHKKFTNIVGQSNKTTKT